MRAGGVSAHLREAQFDASLFESAGKLFQLLQVAGFLRVRSHRGNRGHAPATAHIHALVSLRRERHDSAEMKARMQRKTEMKGQKEASVFPLSE